jgi:hypothetical protein
MAETIEMTPLERAARDVANYTGQRLPPQGDIVTCEGIVRAVLQAIREPSEGMVEAGDAEMQSRGCMGGSGHVWEDMIDAALSECPSKRGLETQA